MLSNLLHNFWTLYAGFIMLMAYFNWFIQIPFENSSLHLPEGSLDQTLDLEFAYNLDPRFFDQRAHNVDLQNAFDEIFSCAVQHNEELVQDNLQMQLANSEPHLSMQTKSENEISVGENNIYAFKPALLGGEEGLKKVDSFSRWVTKELGEVDDLHMRSSSGLSWSTVECGNVVTEESLSPSLSQDQLFSIIDFSPKWAYADSKTEVFNICFLCRKKLLC